MENIEQEEFLTDNVDNAEIKSEKKGRSNKLFGNKEGKLKEELETVKSELAEAKDKYLRLFAEFDNYKKRSIKEKLEYMRSASQETLKAMLPVLDDFERAKKSADDDKSSEQFSDGVTLVYQKLHAVMANQGLKAMETNGEVFDPELHDAITEIPAASDDMKGRIVDTVEKGFLLNDKIIRHAKVVVGK